MPHTESIEGPLKWSSGNGFKNFASRLCFRLYVYEGSQTGHCGVTLTGSTSKWR